VVNSVEGWCEPGDLDSCDVIIWCADKRIIMIVDERGEIYDYDELLRGGLP
jgi:hypothetical protein